MTTFGPVVPILRMHDVTAAKRFYVDYLGCAIDWQDGEGDQPVYLQVSRGSLVLHLSSHHDDGTPGSAVLIETDGIDALHAELASTTNAPTRVDHRQNGGFPAQKLPVCR